MPTNVDNPPPPCRRALVVTADDFGIGPDTSRGILDLAARGAVTAAVLLAHSPYAEDAVRAWRAAGEPLDLGWHPCLTLDRPVLPAGAVPSLVDADGHFLTLGSLVRRLLTGRLRVAEAGAEWRAQRRRFLDLVGRPPALVNGHHHVHVFPRLGPLLRDLLTPYRGTCYVRRVVEPWPLLASRPGARSKRLALNLLGTWARWPGWVGNDALIGVTDPRRLADPECFARMVRGAPGRVVELVCHPGHADKTLGGRDGTPVGGIQPGRVHERDLLARPEFLAACHAAGFTLTRPSQLIRPGAKEAARAA